MANLSTYGAPPDAHSFAWSQTFLKCQSSLGMVASIVPNFQLTDSTVILWCAKSCSHMFPITIAGIPYIYILHPFPFNDLPALVKPFTGWCCWFSQSRTSWRTAKSAQCLTLWDHGNSQWSEECLVEGGADFNLLSVLNIHMICLKDYRLYAL